MNFVMRRSYIGPVEAVILDWAGTAVDYGCLAPAAVFVEVFEQHDIHLTLSQARGPMGMFKKDHIRTLLQLESVASQWQTVHDRLWTEDDVEQLYQEFIPLQRNVIAQYADPIPGVVETIDRLRDRGLKIGSTTGYTRALLDVLAPAAQARGYAPDTIVCADEVPAGRPYPWMCYRNQIDLNVYPGEVCVKIGDTVPDIEEGLNAGMWTIGVVKCGNEIGLSESEIAQLPAAELDARLKAGHKHLRYAGAHYTVDSLTEVPALLEAINTRLARGERP
jgi:phosphonoacetaldehyde hydrolase